MLTKRFIAGAVCPSCQQRDKIQLDKSSSAQQIECVNCGYHQSQPRVAVDQPKEQNNNENNNS